jgi:hypothetical protein
MPHDDYPSTPTLFSHESASIYPLDDTLSSIHRDVSFSSEGHSADVPLLKFTPPSIKDLAALALTPVGSLDDLLQSTDVDACHSVPQSKSFPIVPRPKQQSRGNRAVAIIGSNLVIDGVSVTSEQDVLQVSAAGDIKNVKLKKRRYQADVIHAWEKENQALILAQEMKDNNSKITRRKSIVVNVWSPLTCELCKFWVSRDESLEEFKGRVRQKLGVDIGLFIQEEMLAEVDWNCLPAGSRITARPISEWPPSSSQFA